MKISNIKESGSNNILMFAISNGANIKEDLPLISLINDETFYLVTLEDINFFELFRLTQFYRDKLRILNEKIASVPSMEYLKEAFPGNVEIEGENISLSDASQHVIENFMNLTSQMSTDNDIIQPNAMRLFIPMIARRFDVQIPLSFIDLIDSISDEESSKLFTPEYPKTLQEIINPESSHSFKLRMSIEFIKATQIIKYNTNYDRYLKSMKYFPIKSTPSSIQHKYLFKTGLVGFFKYDSINRGEVRCNLFKSNQNLISTTMKRLSILQSDLKFDFAIQLPIQYMQILENSFGREKLIIQYESSMNSILDNGLVYNDFKTLEYDEETDEVSKKMEVINNSIEAYRVRITEADQILLNTIPLLLQSGVDTSTVFSMLPSIYSTKAVITVTINDIINVIGYGDPLFASMFEEMHNIAKSVIKDIQKMK